MKILFSNIGYAKGIDGTLWQHVSRAGRHLYCPVPVQMHILGQIKNIMAEHTPDFACFVEVDQGSLHSAYLNQLQHIITDDYPFFDAANKYGEDNWRRNMPLTNGRSNAFLARTAPEYERLYFKNGTKRLLYKLKLKNGALLLFTHFSLRRDVRVKQFQEIREIILAQNAPVILMGDFNILHGFSELAPLMDGTGLTILSDENKPTFRFYNRAMTLDLCICSTSIAEGVSLETIDQPYSDHDALLLTMPENI